MLAGTASEPLSLSSRTKASLYPLPRPASENEPGYTAGAWKSAHPQALRRERGWAEPGGSRLSITEGIWVIFPNKSGLGQEGQDCSHLCHVTSSLRGHG